jgi:hypothetical protein
MTRRLIDHNPITGEAVWYTFDRASEQAVITHEQDVRPILERNKIAANDTDKTKRGIKQDWWKYASIPNVVLIDWKQRLGVDFDNPNHQKKIFQLLNSPEYQYLKSTSKHHGG